MDRHRNPPDVASEPEPERRRTDVQQPLMAESEHVPAEWRPLLDQEDPQPPHIKEEQEEVWSSQDGEQLQQLEEADISKESRFQDLKDLFKQQLLSAAREDLIGHFETTIFRYEKEISRRQKLLDVVLNPEIKLRRAVCPDVQQLSREDVPTEQQRWSPLLVKEEPEPPHIKEEQEELWSSQDGEQLQQLEEADISKFTFTPVPVKSEDDDDDEEKPQSSQLHQTQTEQMRREAAGEDCGGPEPARNSDPQRHLGPDEETEGSSETEVSDGDWEETSEPPSSSASQKKNEVVVGDINFSSVERTFSCSECGQRFGRKPHLNAHMRVHTGEKPFSCSFCGKRFSQKGNSISHMRLHTGEKPFSCSVCKKCFRHSGNMSRHMKFHAGRKTLKGRKASIKNKSHTGSEFPVAETEVSCEDLEETRGSRSGFTFGKHNQDPKRNKTCDSHKKTFSRSHRYPFQHVAVRDGEERRSLRIFNKRLAGVDCCKSECNKRL